jgi:subtilisin family serine protease
MDNLPQSDRQPKLDIRLLKRVSIGEPKKSGLFFANRGEGFAVVVISLCPQTLSIPENMSRRNQKMVRRLGGEQLESRNLMAGDLGNSDRSFLIQGSLTWYDPSDVIELSVERAAELQINLGKMRRDADLFLKDASGNILSESIRRGSSDESISLSLEAGDYFVYVVSRSRRWNTYELSIAANFSPIAQPTPTNQPTPTPTTDNIPSLKEVATFGGTREWNLNAIAAPEAWAAGYTGQGTTIAVIDTGVDLDHPDLVSSLFVNAGEIAGNNIDDDSNGFVDDVHGYDFAGRDANPNDTNGHGTHVAGTIAASKNGVGATGVAPDAKILPIRVLSDDGSGSSIDVAAGIRYAAQMGADIINLSVGGQYSSVIDAAIRYAGTFGSLVVIAAGNEAASVPSYPARFSSQYSHVISVGAYGSSGSLASFSNDVGNSRSVQVDAPGAGIFSAYVGGGYATLSGTSMAAPHIAGLASLILSANPNLTSPELRSLLAQGTIGKANGSDSLGKASAKSSVAYAAAGLSFDGASLSTKPSTNSSSQVARASSFSTIGSREVTRLSTTSIAIDSLFSNSNFRGNLTTQEDLLNQIAEVENHVIGKFNSTKPQGNEAGYKSSATRVDLALKALATQDEDAPSDWSLTTNPMNTSLLT